MFLSLPTILRENFGLTGLDKHRNVRWPDTPAVRGALYPESGDFQLPVLLQPGAPAHYSQFGIRIASIEFLQEYRHDINVRVRGNIYLGGCGGVRADFQPLRGDVRLS